MTMLQDRGFKTDSTGILVVQADGDRGDTPQKTSMAHIAWIADERPLVRTCEEFMEAVDYHWSMPYGGFCRDKTGIWNDPKDFSRDQHDPVIICLGLYGKTDQAIRQMRWFKYQNKDIGGPSTWSLNIRAGIMWYLYPLLFLFDIQLLISSIVIAFTKDTNEVDDDNHICRLTQALMVFPTPVSFLARKVYAIWRPLNNGNRHGLLPKGRVEAGAIMGALAWKHRESSGGNPAMVELWRPVIERWFV